MNEVLHYLEDQPELWPRWRRGFTSDETGPLATTDQHLFVFVRVDAQGFGRIYSACHFMAGATTVAYDEERRLETNGSEPLCEDCFEVELQHGIASL